MSCSVPVLLKVCSGASVDRNESGKTRTTVVNFFHTQTNTTGHLVHSETNVYHDDEDDDNYEDDYLSGDYDLNVPRGRVASFLFTEGFFFLSYAVKLINHD